MKKLKFEKTLEPSVFYEKSGMGNIKIFKNNQSIGEIKYSELLLSEDLENIFEISDEILRYDLSFDAIEFYYNFAKKLETGTWCGKSLCDIVVVEDVILMEGYDQVDVKEEITNRFLDIITDKGTKNNSKIIIGSIYSNVKESGITPYQAFDSWRIILEPKHKIILTTDVGYENVDENELFFIIIEK